MKETQIEDLTEKMFKEVAKNKNKIIDDFLKAYIAHRWDDYFRIKGNIEIGRIELVEQIKSPTERVYFFRLRRGKIKF